MKFKLISTDYTNEMLLDILPFETGYLLRENDEEHIDRPCENSVMLAMMLRGLEYSMAPHKIPVPWEN